MHLFITPKPDRSPGLVKIVEVDGRTYLVMSSSGFVFETGDDDAGVRSVYRLGPVASQARKISGWFQ
jgi:hypothetical protein